MHLALPALEALHKALTTQLAREKYKGFISALQAGLTKIEEYYDRTADSDTYTFSMRCVPLLIVCYCSLSFIIYPIVVLDPSQKADYIQKYWGADKLDGILEHAEQKVRFLFYLTILLAFTNKS